MVIYHLSNSTFHIMKPVFAGTHLEKSEYDAFKANARKEGRTVRGHLRFITRQHLATIGFDPDAPVATRRRKPARKGAKAA